MKRLSLLTCVLLLPLAGCTDARPPDTRIGDLGTGPESIQSSTFVAPPGQTPPPAAPDIGKQRQQAQKELASLEHDLQVLKDRAKNASAEAQVQLQPTIDALEKETAATRARLEALRALTAEAWQAAQPDFNRAMQHLHEAYRKAAKKFTGK